MIALEDQQVRIRVCYSSLNYKDALAVTGRGPILKKTPLVAGIDASGVVHESKSSLFKPGDPVLINGCGFGETKDGGFAEYLVAPAHLVIPLPPHLTLKEAMELGTAGFTAGLAIWRMKENSQTPKLGPLAVTGANGGVGSWAISIASHLGFEVWAYSSRLQYSDDLKKLGAQQVYPLDELLLSEAKPLESAILGGAIDNLGGQALTKLLARTQIGGNVASIGLAQSSQLETTVMPFILRGVSLLGVSSTNCDQEVRKRIWSALVGPWRPKTFNERIITVIQLEELVSSAHALLDRKLNGRVIVQLSA